MRTDGQKDGQTDMTKLMVAFCLKISRFTHRVYLPVLYGHQTKSVTSVYTINCFFKTDMTCVYCAVRAELLHTIYVKWFLIGFTSSGIVPHFNTKIHLISGHTSLVFRDSSTHRQYFFNNLILFIISNDS